MAVSGLSVSIRAIPTNEIAVRKYRTVQIRLDSITALGMSFTGFFESSERVVMKSKPK